MIESDYMDKLPTTIKECHEVIILLLSKLDDLAKRVETLELECNRLRVENTELKERLNNNSDNSSLPPSKSFRKKKNNKAASIKKKGGQPGHKGHHRALLPVDEVDFVVPCELSSHCPCGG